LCNATIRRVAIVSHPDPVLADVLGILDATVLRVPYAHDGLRAPVADVTILDRTDAVGLQPGTLVLAVGVAADTGEAVALVDRAGEAGAAAVAFRAGPPPPRLVEIAREAGVTLLTVPPEMAWGQLYALLRTATGGSGPARGEAAGVPVGDLFALADAVAAAVDAPVTVEDTQWRVLAYSNLDDQPIDEPRRQTILGRTPPEVWRTRLEAADVRIRLRAGEGVVRFEYPGLAPRLAAPVRAGGELIGSLWAAEGATPLGAEAESELLRLADLAAIHLVAHRAGDDLQRRLRGAMVSEVLEGELPPGAPRLTGPLSVLAFELAPADRGQWTGDPERILSMVSLYAENTHRHAMCALVGERIWAIVPAPAGRGHEVVVELARTVVERVENVLHVHVRAGVGPTVADVSGLPRSSHAAEQALELLDRLPDQRVLHVDEVRSQIALLEALDAMAQVESLREGGVAALRAHDGRRGTDYAGTLRAWLDNHGDVARTAAELAVHANTVRYRLRRAAEVGGFDLGDPDVRLVAALSLRLG
jgi:GAF domain-containing protein